MCIIHRVDSIHESVAIRQIDTPAEEDARLLDDLENL